MMFLIFGSSASNTLCRSLRGLDVNALASARSSAEAPGPRLQWILSSAGKGGKCPRENLLIVDELGRPPGGMSGGEGTKQVMLTAKFWSAAACA